jgi:hypothetical protein
MIEQKALCMYVRVRNKRGLRDTYCTCRHDVKTIPHKKEPRDPHFHSQER